MTPAWFLDDVVSARFPAYCRGNVGEIVPDVATPLSATVATEAFRLAFRAMFTESGAFSAAELAEPAATGGVFGGCLYFNMSFARSFAARTPGMRVADVDRQMFGGPGRMPLPRRVSKHRTTREPRRDKHLHRGTRLLSMSR